MPPDEVVVPDADDVFAQAFAQLSAADATVNGKPTEPEVVATGPTGSLPARTEDDRAQSEAQRDAATFKKPDQSAGPTGPSGGEDTTAAAGSTAGTTGATGATGTTGGGDGLPLDDKARAAAAEAEAARVAAEAAAAEAAKTAGKKGDPIERLVDLLAQRQPADQGKTGGDQPADPLGMFNAEEKKFLADYEKEYPDVARAEFMRRRVEYAQLTSWMFQQINAVLQPKFEQYDSVVTRAHAGDLQQAVPTYDNALRDKVIAWAGQQPAYKRVAYEYVIQQGTVEDVADLIQDFTKATGYVPPVKAAPTGGAGATGGAPDAAAQAKAAADAAKAAVAARLAPVKSGNTQRPAAAIAANDYDGGFDWATRELANL